MTIVCNKQEYRVKQHWENMGFVNDYLNYLNWTNSTFSESVKNFIECDFHQTSFFAWMVDETTDISEKTQFSIVVNFVDYNGIIQEYFLGLYNVNEDRMANDLCKTLEKFNVNLKLVVQI